MCPNPTSEQTAFHSSLDTSGIGENRFHRQHTRSFQTSIATRFEEVEAVVVVAAGLQQDLVSAGCHRAWAQHLRGSGERQHPLHPERDVVVVAAGLQPLLTGQVSAGCRRAWTPHDPRGGHPLHPDCGRHLDAVLVWASTADRHRTAEEGRDWLASFGVECQTGPCTQEPSVAGAHGLQRVTLRKGMMESDDDPNVAKVTNQWCRLSTQDRQVGRVMSTAGVPWQPRCAPGVSRQPRCIAGVSRQPRCIAGVSWQTRCIAGVPWQLKCAAGHWSIQHLRQLVQLLLQRQRRLFLLVVRRRLLTLSLSLLFHSQDASSHTHGNSQFLRSKLKAIMTISARLQPPHL